MNRGTLEIWTHNSDSPIGKRIRKIKRYDRERIVYDESFMKALEEMSDDKHTVDENKNYFVEDNFPVVEQMNNNEILPNIEEEYDETQQQEEKGLQCEYEEVFDTVTTTQVETIEETGPVETVYMNEVLIDSIHEDVIELQTDENKNTCNTITFIPNGHTERTKSTELKGEQIVALEFDDYVVIDLVEDKSIKCRDKNSTSVYLYLN